MTSHREAQKGAFTPICQAQPNASGGLDLVAACSPRVLHRKVVVGT